CALPISPRRPVARHRQRDAAPHRRGRGRWYAIGRRADPRDPAGDVLLGDPSEGAPAPARPRPGPQLAVTAPAPGHELAAAHARFARAVLLIYLGTAVVAVVLLVAALATDLSYQNQVARETLQLETEVHAYYLGRHLHLLAGELARLGLRSEVNLLDRNNEPERSLLRLSHEKSAFFNVGVAVVGPDGAPIWSEPQSFLPAGVPLSNENWFQAVLRTPSILIVPVQTERDREPVLYMVSPILRGGQFQGILLGAIDLALEGALGTEF